MSWQVSSVMQQYSQLVFDAEKTVRVLEEQERIRGFIFARQNFLSIYTRLDSQTTRLEEAQSLAAQHREYHLKPYRTASDWPGSQSTGLHGGSLDILFWSNRLRPLFARLLGERMAVASNRGASW